MQLNSLSFKVLLAYVAGMVCSIAVLVIAALVILQTEVLAKMDLAGLAEDMAARVQVDGNDRPVSLEADGDDFVWVFESLRRETAYRIVDAEGNVALVSSAGEGFWPASDRLELPRKRFDFQHDGVTIHGATAAVPRGEKTWYLQVAVSTRLMTLLHRVALPLVGAGIMAFSLVLLATFSLCAYLTLRYTLGPLRALSDSAAAISPRSLDARLSTRAVPAEIVPLVASFNRALERLEEGYRIQQDFLSTAAHELKTPLALIRAQVELTNAGELRDALLSDVGHMTRQVQQLLHLAEASEPQTYHFALVDVHDVVEEAAGYLKRMADGAGVTVTISDRASPVRWPADRGAFFTLLENLLENAIEHAPRGTSVRVTVSAEMVTVRDYGPGVSQDQLAQMFSRFWRGPHRRDHGAGLGLAICREIALAHGWTLVAEPAHPGLRLTVSWSGGP